MTQKRGKAGMSKFARALPVLLLAWISTEGDPPNT